MRPKPPEVGRRIVLERWPRFWRGLGFRWQMVIRGIVRHRLRAFTSVFSAMMGAGLILQTLQIDDSFHELITFTFDRMLVSDFDVTLKDEVDWSGFLEAKRLPGVDYAEPMLSVGCTFYNGHRTKRGAVTGILPTARLTVPRNGDGQPLRMPDHGLVLDATPGRSVGRAARRSGGDRAAGRSSRADHGSRQPDCRELCGNRGLRRLRLLEFPDRRRAHLEYACKRKWIPIPPACVSSITSSNALRACKVFRRCANRRGSCWNCSSR